MMNWISNLNPYQAMLIGTIFSFLLTYLTLIKKNNDFIEEQRLLNEQYYNKMLTQMETNDKENHSE